MSQFEFIMVMVSLILALALAQALRGLSEIVTSRNRHQPHTIWVIAYVFLIAQHWWAYWDFNLVDEWRFTTYLLALTMPAIVFASVYLLVPATRSADIDWREQFYRVKQWFFGLGIAYVLLAIFVNVEYFGTPLIHPYRLFQASYLIIYLVGFVSSNEKVQRALPILLFVSFVSSQLLIRMNIGALMAD